MISKQKLTICRRIVRVRYVVTVNKQMQQTGKNGNTRHC